MRARCQIVGLSAWASRKNRLGGLRLCSWPDVHLITASWVSKFGTEEAEVGGYVGVETSDIAAAKACGKVSKAVRGKIKTTADQETIVAWRTTVQDQA